MSRRFRCRSWYTVGIGIDQESAIPANDVPTTPTPSAARNMVITRRATSLSRAARAERPAPGSTGHDLGDGPIVEFHRWYEQLHEGSRHSHGVGA